MKDKYLSAIRNQQRLDQREYLFPKEHLGIADRFLFNMAIKESLAYMEQHTERIAFTTMYCKVLEENLEKYGFKPRKVVLK